jgi:hypothetical protein
VTSVMRLGTRRRVLRLVLAGAAAPLAGCSFLARAAHAVDLPPAVVWKDPGCDCCDGWARHMRHAGFSVTVRESDNMAAIKRARGVPDDLRSCHTAVIDGYVIEGHVPAPDVVRLLAERPAAKGLSAPGMPASAPGMDRPGEPYSVILFGTSDGNQSYAQH